MQRGLHQTSVAELPQLSDQVLGSWPMHRRMMLDTLAQSSLDGPRVLGKVRAPYV